MFIDKSPKIINLYDWNLVLKQNNLKFEITFENEIPFVLSIQSTRKFSNEFNIKLIEPLPNISDQKFTLIYTEKIEICSYIIDFLSSKINNEFKDLKSRCLCELVQFFEQSIEVRKLSIELQEITFKMLEKNIFDQIPVFPTKILSNNFSVVIVDPSWPHLFYSFQILNRFIQLFSESILINLNIAKKALFLLNLPDNNERLQLLAFLRSYYDIRPTERNSIVILIQHQLINFIHGLLPPYSITPLLVLLAHIFTRSGRNPSPEYIKTIKIAVFPLLLSSNLQFFHQQILQLFNTILINQSPLIFDYFIFIISNFPILNTSKIIFFLDNLFLILPKLEEEIIKKYLKRIYKIISQSMISNNSKIVEFSLNILFKPKLDDWIINNAKHTVYNLFEPIKNVSENHWNNNIKSKAIQALGEMGKLHRQAFIKMRNVKGIADLKAKRHENEKNTMRNWANLAKSYYGENQNDYRIMIQSIKDNFDLKKIESFNNQILLSLLNFKKK